MATQIGLTTGEVIPLGEFTASQLNLLSKVATPRGNPPNVSGDRNWLLTSASQEQRGELYQTTIEWTLSEREGWDSFLYS
jgi:hypothetical protein